jgi:Domain of unknown function (DUF5668)
MTKTTQERGREREQQRWSAAFTGLVLLAVGVAFTVDSVRGVPIYDPWRYWPAALIPPGLAAAVLPTGSGNQAWGVFMAGTGVVLLLQNMGAVHWTFGHSWPILLVLAGGLLLVLPLRRGEHGGGGALAEPEHGEPDRGEGR